MNEEVNSMYKFYSFYFIKILLGEVKVLERCALYVEAVAICKIYVSQL